MNKTRFSVSGVSLVAILITSGCTTTGSSGGAIDGLPRAEFNRVFIAAISVTAAEHCDVSVDNNLVRANLIKYQTDQGLESQQVTRSGEVYDSVQTSFKSRIESDPDYCTTQYKGTSDILRRFEAGDFSTSS